jgi:hypothetical protein
VFPNLNGGCIKIFIGNDLLVFELGQDLIGEKSLFGQLASAGRRQEIVSVACLVDDGSTIRIIERFLHLAQDLQGFDGGVAVTVRIWTVKVHGEKKHSFIHLSKPNHRQPRNSLGMDPRFQNHLIGLYRRFCDCVWLGSLFQSFPPLRQMLGGIHCRLFLPTVTPSLNDPLIRFTVWFDGTASQQHGLKNLFRHGPPQVFSTPSPSFQHAIVGIRGHDFVRVVGSFHSLQ